MNDLRLVMRNLSSSWSRFALTLTGITLGITALVVMMSLGSGLRTQINQQATDLGANLVITPKGWCAYEQVKVLSGYQLPDAIPPEELAKIEQLEGFSTLPYLTVGSAIANEPVPVTGIRVADTLAQKGWAVAEGQAPRDGEYELLAGPDVAGAFGLRPGSAVTLRGTEFTVTGVLEPTGTRDDGVLFIPIDVATVVYETDGRVSFVAVKVDDITKVELHAKRITDAANVAVASDKQMLASVLSVVDSVGTTLRIIAAVAILTAAFGIVNTMLMATFERRRDIGILKSVGCSNARVFRLFLVEAAAYGLIGGLVGLIVGSLVSQFITPYIASNEFTAFVGSASVKAIPSWTDMGLILGGAVLVAAVAGVYPALRAARLTPVEAISYE